MPVGAVPFPFGVCRICKDKATGLHYGVATCEGCKGFFKRSISKAESFKCIYDDKCDITPYSRSRCKACRFKRCMETGMSVESVRMGRIPNTEKNKVMDVFRRGGSDLNKHELIVNPTGSGNFDFNLTTTSVASTPIIPTVTSSSLSTGMKWPMHASSDGGHSDASASSSEYSSVCNGNIPPASGDSNNSTPVLNAYGNVDSDLFTSFLSQVGLSLEQNVYLPESEGLPVFDDDITIKNEVGSLPNKPHINGFTTASQCNNGSTVQTFVNSCKQQMTQQGAGDRSSLPGNRNTAEEAICVNPFSDVYAAKRLQPWQRRENVPSNIETVLNQKQLVTGVERNGLQNGHHHVNRFQTGTSIGSDNGTVSSNHAQSFRFNNMPAHSHESKNAGGFTTAETSLSQRNDNHAQGNQIETTPNGSSKSVYKLGKGLENILLEHMLNSKGGVQMICEKIEEISKRRTIETNICNQNDVTNSFPKNDQMLNDIDVDFIGGNGNGLESQMESQPMDTDWQGSGGPTSCPISELTNGDVLVPTNTADGLHSQEDNLLINLQGIAQGMKLLFRDLPEHREKIRKFKLGLINLRILTDNEVEETYKKVIDSIPDCNERIIGFCKMVPGINSLDHDDQEALIKRSYYDIWMLSTAEYFNKSDSLLFLTTGEIYSTSAMRKILNDEMVDTILKFANQFNALGLTDLEKCILCAVRLSAPESLELKNRASVDKFHSDMLDIFANEIKKNHEKKHPRLLIDTFCLMPLLETCNYIQKNIIAMYSLDGPSNQS